MTDYSHSLNGVHVELDRQLAETVADARRADWGAYRARLLALREQLLDHIAYEDEELYPTLEKSGLGPANLAALREDHACFREQLEALGAAAPQHDPEGCIAELERLSTLQHAHHAREQAACYAYADRLALAPPPGPRAQPPSPQGAAPMIPQGAAPMDLRGLQPPEPIVRIFQALERASGEPVRAILPHEPVPLYALLRERGFRYDGTQRSDGGFELLIRKA